MEHTFTSDLKQCCILNKALSNRCYTGLTLGFASPVRLILHTHSKLVTLLLTSINNS